MTPAARVAAGVAARGAVGVTVVMGGVAGGRATRSGVPVGDGVAVGGSGAGRGVTGAPAAQGCHQASSAAGMSSARSRARLAWSGDVACGPPATWVDDS